MFISYLCLHWFAYLYSLLIFLLAFFSDWFVGAPYIFWIFVMYSYIFVTYHVNIFFWYVIWLLILIWVPCIPLENSQILKFKSVSLSSRFVCFLEGFPHHRLIKIFFFIFYSLELYLALDSIWNLFCIWYEV